MREHLAIAQAATVTLLLFGTAATAKDRCTVTVVNKSLYAAGGQETLSEVKLMFDAGTVLRDGDRISGDLSSGASLTHDIDFAIVGVSGAAVPTGTGGLTTTPIGADTDDTAIWYVYCDKTSTNEPGITVVTTNGASGIWFRMHGMAGTCRINIDVLDDEAPGSYLNPLNYNGNTTLTVGGDPDTRFCLKVLNGIPYDGSSGGGVWAFNDSEGDGVYGENGSADYLQATNDTDNVFGITANLANGEEIKLYMDRNVSCGVTFVPSDPVVAHVIPLPDIPLQIFTAVEIEFPTSTDGQRYQVEWCNSLLTDKWFDLGDPIQGGVGTTGSVTVFDSTRGVHKRFYRVVHEH